MLWWAIGRAIALKYDGEAFWEAMEQGRRRRARIRSRWAEISSELAFQTAARSGMWRPCSCRRARAGSDRSSVVALPAGEPRPRESARRPRLLASARRGREAAQAVQLAEQLEDVELLSYALDASSLTSYAVGDYERGLRRQLAGGSSFRIESPTRTISRTCVRVASQCVHRTRTLRRGARACSRIRRDREELTPHHQLHGVALLVEVEELAGEWEAIRALEPEVERAVAANLATPCVRNARSLLVCALARERLGEREASRPPRGGGAELAPEARGARLALPKIQLALRRGRARSGRGSPRRAGRRGSERHLVPRSVARHASCYAMAALGDARGVEEEAPPLLRPATYLEPFALRALGWSGATRRFSSGRRRAFSGWACGRSPRKPRGSSPRPREASSAEPPFEIVARARVARLSRRSGPARRARRVRRRAGTRPGPQRAGPARDCASRSRVRALLDRREQPLDDGSGLWVERGTGLVEENHVGLGWRAHARCRAAVAVRPRARARTRRAVHPPRRAARPARAGSRTRQPALAFAGDEAVLAKREGDVVVDRHRERVRQLEDVPDPPPQLLAD